MKKIQRKLHDCEFIYIYIFCILQSSHPCVEDKIRILGIVTLHVCLVEILVHTMEYGVKTNICECYSKDLSFESWV
jgi:hypothetical protein